MSFSLLCLCFLLIQCCFCAEQVLYVSANGKTTGECGTTGDACTLKRALVYLTTDSTILSSPNVAIQMDDGIYSVVDYSFLFPSKPKIETLSFLPSSNPEGDIKVTWKAVMPGTRTYPPILRFSDSKNTPHVTMKGIEFELTLYSENLIEVTSDNVEVHFEMINCRFLNYTHVMFDPTPFDFSNSNNNNITLFLKNVEFDDSTISGLVKLDNMDKTLGINPTYGMVNITMDGGYFNGGRVTDNFIDIPDCRDFYIIFRNLQVRNISIKGSFVRISSQYTSKKSEDKFQELSFIGCRFKNVVMPELGNLVRANPTYRSTLTNLIFRFSMIDSSFDTIEIHTPFILFFDFAQTPSFIAKFHNVNVTSFSGEGTFLYWSGIWCQTKKSSDEAATFTSRCVVEIKDGYYLNNQLGDPEGDMDWGGIYHSSSKSWGSYKDMGVMTVDGSVFEDNTILGDCGGAISAYNQIVRISNTKFIRNHAMTNEKSIGGNGGAICIDYEPACDGCLNYVKNSIFDSNTATKNGGGMKSGNMMNMEISSTVFRQNVANNSGGSLYLAMDNDFGLPSHSLLTIDANSRIENSNAEYGGGMFVSMDEDGEMNIDCSVEKNNASIAGGGIYFVEKASKASHVINNNAKMCGPNMISGPKKISGLDLIVGTCTGDESSGLSCELKGFHYLDYFGTKLSLPFLKSCQVELIYKDTVGDWTFDVTNPTKGESLVLVVEEGHSIECMTAGESDVRVYLDGRFQGNVKVKFPGDGKSFPIWLIFVISGSLLAIVLLFCSCVFVVSIILFTLVACVGGCVRTGSKIGKKPQFMEYDRINTDDSVF